MVHLTSDPGILDRLPRPTGIYLNEVPGFMTPEDQTTVRARALEVIKAFRGGGYRLPPAPSPEVVHRMMNCLAAGKAVPL